MGIAGKNRSTGRLRALVLAVLVCAWLVPSGVAVASSSQATTAVNLNVEDSIALKTGSSVVGPEHELRPLQVLTQFVARTASSRLTQAGTEVGLPIGQGAEPAGGAAQGEALWGGLFEGGDLVVTVTKL